MMTDHPGGEKRTNHVEGWRSLTTGEEETDSAEYQREHVSSLATGPVVEWKQVELMVQEQEAGGFEGAVVVARGPVRSRLPVTTRDPRPQERVPEPLETLENRASRVGVGSRDMVQVFQRVLVASEEEYEALADSSRATAACSFCEARCGRQCMCVQTSAGSLVALVAQLVLRLTLLRLSLATSFFRSPPSEDAPLDADEPWQCKWHRLQRESLLLPRRDPAVGHCPINQRVNQV